MTYVVAAIVGLSFGSADQLLGSRSSLGAWAAAISGASAPWLLLGFLAGMTQERIRRAATVAIVATIPALIGYFAMTCSPMENVPTSRAVTCATRIATTGYNPLWIAGAVLISPIYGVLGHRWRVDRWWVSAAVLVATFCFEAPARSVLGLLSGPAVVWVAEVVVGVAAAAGFAIALRTGHSTRSA